MKRLLATAAFAFALTGCMAAPQALPAETVTATVTETVSRPAVTETVEEDTLSDREVARMALQITWDNMAQSDVDNICEVWTEYPTARSVLVDEFMDGAGDFGDELGRDAVSDFFSEECAAS